MVSHMADGPTERSQLAWWIGGVAIILVALAGYFAVRDPGPGIDPSRSVDTAPAEVAQPETSTLSVEVNTRNGTPVEDAQVRVASSGLWPPLEATTDERGVAEFLEVPVGVLVVQALFVLRYSQ